MHRKYRQNPDEDLRALEREYDHSGDLNILLKLNNLRARNGLPPYTVPALNENSLESYLAPYLSNNLMLLPINGLQFPGFKAETISGFPILPNTEADYQRCLELMIQVAQAARQVGWFGLLIEKAPPAPVEEEDEDGIPIQRIPKLVRHYEYPKLYLLPQTILHPSGELIDIPGYLDASNLIADQWLKGEDPRTLTQPELRRGAYPVKVVLVKRNDDTYVTWQCIYPYDQGNVRPNLAHGHYEIRTLEEGYLDYIIRLLKMGSFGRDPNQYRLII